MAKGENAKKYSINKTGREWWSRRPLSGHPISRTKGNKYFKRLTHKIERRNNKKIDLE
jgi:hypothetical protein